MSIIKGLLVTSNIFPIIFNLSVMLRISLSGFPKKVESVNELDQKPSNSLISLLLLIDKFSAINDAIGLCVSIILTIFFVSISFFNDEIRGLKLDKYF